jgi:outer membrane protein
MKANVLCTKFVVICGVICCTTYAQTLVQPLTVREAFQRARSADPTIQAAAQALDAGREKAVQGSALFKPQVALAASVTGINTHADATLPPAFSALMQPDTSGSVRQTALQFVQPLFNATADANQRQLTLQSEEAELKWAAAQQDLILRVSEAYLAVLSAQEALRVVTAQAIAIEHQRDRAQARFDVGSGRVTDLQEAQARLDGAQTRVLATHSSLSLRMAQFQELVGAAPNRLALLPSKLEDAELSPLVPDNLSAWQLKGVDHNVRLLAMRKEVAIAAAEPLKYRLLSRPTLDLVGSYSVKNKSGDLSLLVSADFERTATVGLQFKIPLYTGGIFDSRERESMARARQAELELAGAQRDVRLQIQEAFLSVSSGISKVRALQLSMQSAGSALDATTLGRDIGNRTQLDVLDAQQRMYGTEQDLIQARLDVMLSRIRLAWAAGELEEQDLQRLDQVLKP